MSADMSLSISRSKLDEQRFYLRVARASNVTLANIPVMLDFCWREQIELLIARCAVVELAAVHAMEAAGFLLMDTLLYYACDLSKDVPPSPGKIRVRPAQASDEQAVIQIAARAFHGYASHYHADPRLDRATCDDAYIDWALRSLRHEAADEMLVAGEGNHIVGFLSIKTLSPTDMEGPLLAVLPEAQGQGVGRALMTTALHWSQQKGARRMLMSTQVTNRASQTVWARVGFSPHQAYYTFHKWFTDQI